MCLCLCCVCVFKTSTNVLGERRAGLFYKMLSVKNKTMWTKLKTYSGGWGGWYKSTHINKQIMFFAQSRFPFYVCVCVVFLVLFIYVVFLRLCLSSALFSQNYVLECQVWCIGPCRKMLRLTKLRNAFSCSTACNTYTWTSNRIKIKLRAYFHFLFKGFFIPWWKMQ